MTKYSYTHFVGPDADALEERAEACAKGTYQRNLLFGGEAWSGNTLTGAARNSAPGYWRSRTNLLERLTKADIPHRFETIERRKTLVIGNE